MSPSRYWRPVLCRLWELGPFAALPPELRDVALYLLAGPQTTPIGISKFSIELAATTLRLSVGCFKSRFVKVLGAMDWQYDHKTSVLWLSGWSTEHVPNNPNLVKNWRGWFDDIPDGPVKTRAHAEVYRLLSESDRPELAAVFGNAIEVE